MKIYLIILNLIIFLTLFSCAKKKDEISVLKEKNLETQMIETYQQAMEEQQGNQKCDDGNNHQQFQQCKTGAGPRVVKLRHP